MKQTITTLQVTPRTRKLAKQIAALTDTKMYAAIELAVENEFKRVFEALPK